MTKILRLFGVCGACMVFLLVCACSKTGRSGDEDSVQTPLADTVAEQIPEKYIPVPGDSLYVFPSREDILTYLDTCRNASMYKGGILPVIADHVPDYASRLIAALAKYDGFVVVDKASMRVILYDRYGHVDRSYDMACAKNYGTKHKRRDSRTPEGFFTVEGRYNSTEWLYTDDDGRTSQKKGQFGPRFIRLKIPGLSQIGIHGTCSPWSIGHRASHGCIRILNENILELVGLVEPGMPVIVIPGKRDRAVNREEGYDVPYFPTEPQYAMSEAEMAKPVRDKEEIETEEKSHEKDSLNPAEHNPEHHPEHPRVDESESLETVDSLYIQ